MWRPPRAHPLFSRPWRHPDARGGGGFAAVFAAPRGRLALEQRTWVPAMVPWRATEDGFVSDAVLAWYERFARGRPGAIVVEATGIRDVPSGPLLRIGHDRYLDGLCAPRGARQARERRANAAVHPNHRLPRHSPPAVAGKILRAFPATDGRAPARASAARRTPRTRARLLALGEEGWKAALTAREYEALTQGYRERVTDTDLPHIRELPDVLPYLFADAARRAEAAGFDGVELHYAHAYTMASFLSRTNTRDDG